MQTAVKNRKLLVASFYYPPTQRYGGAVRWESFIGHLPRYGWEPHLLACFEGIEDAGPRVTRIRPWIGRTRLFRLDQIGWIPPLYRKIAALISEGYGTVILSGPPMWYLGIALLLRRRFSALRLVIDLRDPWIQQRSTATRATFAETVLKRTLGPQLERRIVRCADLVTVVTPVMREDYAAAYPFAREAIRLLPNGFHVSGIRVSCPSSGPFRILYTGTFDSNQNPRCFFQALQGLQQDDFKAVFVGAIDGQWRRLARSLGVDRYVEFTGPLEHRQALEQMNRAHAFLHILPPTRGRSHDMGGKVYEYLYFGRPVVGIMDPGDCCDLIRRHSENYRFVHDRDPAGIRSALLDLYCRWKQGQKLFYKNINQFDERYNRSAIAGVLAGMLEQLHPGDGP